MYRIGIDLGGTNIAVGVVDDRHQIVAEASVPAGAHRPAEQVVADMCRAVELALDKAGLTVRDCASIGVGAPGTCDPERGVVVCAYNLNWFDVPVCRMLTEHFGLPTRLSNDANCAALAEVVAGAAVSCRSMVLVTLGTGVGGGIVINGRPWSGFHGVGSEIGHIPMDIGGVPCTCGNEGCLERYCSATAIIRMGKQILQQHPESMMMEMVGGDPEKLTAKIVFDAARELDNAAMKVFTTYVDYLAKACYTIIAFLDPEVIVLGGGVSKAGSFLLDAVRARVPKYLLFKTLPYSRIELARLGADAGMIGAAMLGRQA